MSCDFTHFIHTVCNVQTSLYIYIWTCKIQLYLKTDKEITILLHMLGGRYMLKGEGGRTGRPSLLFMSGGVGRHLHVVVWGPHSPCVVLGTRRHLWVVLLGAHGFLWVVFLGTHHFLWVEVLGLRHHLWLVVLAPRSPFGGLGAHHFSWVEVPAFEGEGRGSSFMCVGTHCRSLSLVFCAVCPSLSFAIHHCLSSVSVVASCLSSSVVSCHDMAADMVAGLPIRGGWRGGC